MRFATIACLLAAAGLFAATPAGAAGSAPSCEKIFNICMKRAGSGHAGICEDMYDQAKRTGVWPAAQDENGVKYDPTPCAR